MLKVSYPLFGVLTLCLLFSFIGYGQEADSAAISNHALLISKHYLRNRWLIVSYELYLSPTFDVPKPKGGTYRVRNIYFMAKASLRGKRMLVDRVIGGGTFDVEQKDLKFPFMVGSDDLEPISKEVASYLNNRVWCRDRSRPSA